MSVMLRDSEPARRQSSIEMRAAESESNNIEHIVQLNKDKKSNLLEIAWIANELVVVSSIRLVVARRQHRD